MGLAMQCTLQQPEPLRSGIDFSAGPRVSIEPSLEEIDDVYQESTDCQKGLLERGVGEEGVCD